MFGFRHCIGALGAVALLLAFDASAAKSRPLDLTKPAAEVNEQIDVIQQELADGKTYSEIKPDQKEKVVLALSRISDAVEHGNGRTLAPNDQVTAFNDQEVVNNILTQAREDSRMICKRQKSVGSNMVSPQCMTVAQSRAAREQGRKDLNDMHTMNRFEDK